MANTCAARAARNCQPMMLPSDTSSFSKYSGLFQLSNPVSISPALSFQGRTHLRPYSVLQARSASGARYRNCVRHELRQGAKKDGQIAFRGIVWERQAHFAAYRAQHTSKQQSEKIEILPSMTFQADQSGLKKAQAHAIFPASIQGASIVALSGCNSTGAVEPGLMSRHQKTNLLGIWGGPCPARREQAVIKVETVFLI